MPHDREPRSDKGRLGGYRNPCVAKSFTRPVAPARSAIPDARYPHPLAAIPMPMAVAPAVACGGGWRRTFFVPRRWHARSRRWRMLPGTRMFGTGMLGRMLGMFGTGRTVFLGRLLSQNAGEWHERPHQASEHDFPPINHTSSQIRSHIGQASRSSGRSNHVSGIRSITLNYW